ncbi:MAG: tetratricopeptide repeat protein [Ferruginibacter sp.]
MFKRKLRIISVLSVLCSLCFSSIAQPPTWTFEPFGNEKKPEKFETRKLGSEKTADKNFKLPRHFLQNTVSHYNYYFNANNKLNAVVDRACLSNHDDYSRLLSFYPYSLENTSTQKTELDSVIDKCTAGILLHDLRSDWVDNLYLLIGKSYLMRKDLDSAVMTFQFINYNLFPRKKHEDDNRIVGTREEEAPSAISIANREKRNLLQKTFSRPPSRNEALVWLTRSLIEQEEYSEAAGIINTLQTDPNMPKRLIPFLEEVDAYWFLKQHIYDSAAVHLEKALSNADTKQDKSRWEFLLAQLFEMSGRFDDASDYYDRASKHTTDPLMDIFAKLNQAKMLRNDGNSKEMDNNIDRLLHMSKKDKFETYRDIIFYSAGDIALQKPDTAAALLYLNKSLHYNENNVSYKNKAFLKLADIAYNQRRYKDAYSYYDSLQTGDSSILAERLNEIQTRRTALSKIVGKLAIVNREDSLQKIAAMTATDRDAFIKKMLKRLRREKGLKEDDTNTGSQLITFDNNNKNQPVDLFPTNTKGDWYFDNSSAKGKGFSDFKSKWGNRNNVDNWRRQAASNQAANINFGNPATDAKLLANGIDPSNPRDGSKKLAANPTAAGGQEINYDELIKDVPLTPEKLAASNEMLSQNLFELAKLYQNELQDYQQAIITYEESLQRYPDRLYDGELYYGLYYCYTQLGNTLKANNYKSLLLSRFTNSKAAKTISNPAALDPKTQNPAATQKYNDIYSLFIEGNFDEAIAQKTKADSVYGTNYWTPQLLYIEAVYHIRQKDDSTALKVLQSIITLYPGTGLALKANNLIEVLGRRKQIEKYLTDLNITRTPDDSTIVVPGNPPVISKPVPANPVAVNITPTVTVPKSIVDTVKKISPPPPAVTNGTFILSPSAAHYVVMIMDKVDPVYVGEARNAFDRYNRENFYATPIAVSNDAIDNDIKLLLFTPFADADAALDYYTKIKQAAPREISWLPAAKYSFVIITNDNLQLLKTNKDISGYKKLLNSRYPGKF